MNNILHEVLDFLPKIVVNVIAEYAFRPHKTAVLFRRFLGIIFHLVARSQTKLYVRFYKYHSMYSNTKTIVVSVHDEDDRMTFFTSFEQLEEDM